MLWGGKKDPPGDESVGGTHLFLFLAAGSTGGLSSSGFPGWQRGNPFGCTSVLLLLLQPRGFCGVLCPQGALGPFSGPDPLAERAIVPLWVRAEAVSRVPATEGWVQGWLPALWELGLPCLQPRQLLTLPFLLGGLQVIFNNYCEV